MVDAALFGALLLHALVVNGALCPDDFLGLFLLLQH